MTHENADREENGLEVLYGLSGKWPASQASEVPKQSGLSESGGGLNSGNTSRTQKAYSISR